nr:uncharacterized protein LOC127347969 [Lolium perenne]
MLHHTHRPPPYATTALQAPPPSHHDQRTGVITNKMSHPGARDSTTAATPEGTASTTTCGRRPDASTRSHRAHLAQPSPSGLVKIQPPCAAYAPPAAPSPTPAAPPSVHEGHRPGQGAGPPGPEMEPAGPGSRAGRRCPEPPRRPVARGHATASSPPAAARPGDAPPPEPRRPGSTAAAARPRLERNAPGREGPPPPAPSGLCPTASADGGDGGGRRRGSGGGLGLVAPESLAGERPEGGGRSLLVDCS